MTAPTAFPSSVMLSDWSADVEIMKDRGDATIYEIILLSLLYDQVLIPDEVLVLSDTLATDWGLRRDLLTKLLSLPTVTILKHPIAAYPTAELRDFAARSPIRARAKQLQCYGTKSELPFVPSDVQVKFHHALDGLLTRKTAIARPPTGSTDDPLDNPKRFSRLLARVLSDTTYRPALQAGFGLPNSVADGFALYAAEPNILVRRLESDRRLTRVSRSPDGHVLLNRSLVYQGSAMYPAHAASIRALAQSCLAAVTTWKENSAGRYSRGLRELFLHSSDLEDVSFQPQRPIISVRNVEDVLLDLPPITTDFPHIILKVRTSPEGTALRRLIRDPNASFTEQIRCWRDVSKQLASAVIPVRLLPQFTARASIIETAKHYWQEISVTGLTAATQGTVLEGRHWLEHAVLAAGYGLMFSMGKQAFRSRGQQARFRERLEARLPVRYKPVPVASLVADSI